MDFKLNQLYNSENLKSEDALDYIRQKIIQSLQNLIPKDINFHQMINTFKIGNKNQNLSSQLTIALFDYYQLSLKKNCIAVQQYSKLELLTQKLEQQIRNHIRTQQHLKIYAEGIDQKLKQAQKIKQQKVSLQKKMNSQLKKNKIIQEQLIDKIRDLQENLNITKRLTKNKQNFQTDQLPHLKQLKVKFQPNPEKNHKIYKNSLTNQNLQRQKMSLPTLLQKQKSSFLSISKQKTPKIVLDLNTDTRKTINKQLLKLHLRNQSILNPKYELLKNMDNVYQKKRINSIGKMGFQDNHIVSK